MAQWVQCNFVQITPTWADAACNVTPGRSGLGGDDVPREWRKNPHRGWDKAEWKRRVKEPGEALESTLRAAYAELTGTDAPISVLSQVDAIVRPVAKKSRAEEAPQLRINWAALANDYRRYAALMRLWQEEQEMRALDEDDEEVMLMVMQ